MKKQKNLIKFGISTCVFMLFLILGAAENSTAADEKQVSPIPLPQPTGFYGAIESRNGNCVVISRCPDFGTVTATDNLGLTLYRTYYFELGSSSMPTLCPPIRRATPASCIWY